MINNTTCTSPDDFPQRLPSLADLIEPEDEHGKYRDLMSEFECVTRVHIEQLAEELEVHDTVGVVFPDYWLASLRRAGEVIRHSPSLIECSAVPAGYEKVVDLYHNWAIFAEELGLQVGLYLEARKDGCDDASLARIFQALSAVDAHTSVRSIYLEGLPHLVVEPAVM